MEVAPPARIPANTVAARLRATVMLMPWRGSRGEFFDGSYPIMKTLVSMKRTRAPVRLCASVLAVMGAFPVLAQNVTSLSDVVVTATRFEAKSDTLPFGVSVITRDDLARSGVSTVNEALIKLLGVPGRLDFYGGGDYALDLRGFGVTSDSNQAVVVDGIRINEADLGGTRLAGISINTVERIEVLRGSGSVLYGQGATGGVIVITTKAGKGVARKNTADLYVATGSYNLDEARTNATLSAGGFSLDLAANKRQSDNHRDNFASSTEGNVLQVQWSNDWLRFGVSHASDMLDSQLPGALFAADYAANPKQSTSSNANKTGRIKNSRQTLFASAEIGSWQFGLDAGQRDKELDSKTSGVSTYSYDVDAGTLALKARHTSSIGSLRNALTLGHDQGEWNRIVPVNFGGGTSEQKTNAFYAQDEVTLAAGTKILLGYRSEKLQQSDTIADVNRTQDQTAWELGVTQPVTSAWSIYGRFGSSFRLPNLDEINPLYTLLGAVLETQKSKDFELGSRWAYRDGRAELRYYRSNLTNEIGFNGNLFVNVNFDPSLRQGLEFDATHNLSKNAALQLNVGVREATFTEGLYSGKKVPLVAGTTLALRANWIPAPMHTVNAGVVWVSSQQVDFSNTCRVPSHVTMDARYAYRRNNVEWSLGIGNLLDANYYTLAYGCATGVTTVIYPEAGRAVTAALRVKF